jgi:hypothetical protein
MPDGSDGSHVDLGEQNLELATTSRSGPGLDCKVVDRFAHGPHGQTPGYVSCRIAAWVAMRQYGAVAAEQS